MKTRNFKLIALVLVLLAFGATTFAQVTATATATATIITPIAITKTADMNFGNVAVSPITAGTVILAPAGTRTTGGAGGVTLPAGAGTVTAAAFTVTGLAASTFAITLPASVTITFAVVNTMTVNTFTSTPSGTGTLTGGTQTLQVGATLNVSAGQAAGTYVSGTPFPVTVNYN